MSDDLRLFGERVRESRERQKRSQEEVALEVGISRAYLSQIEQGRATNLSLRLAQSLSSTLHIEQPQQTAITVPSGLRDLAEEEGLTVKQVQMLAGIAYRGKQPQTKEQWRLLYNLIRTTLDHMP